ncbi:MAG TPA: N-acetylneuraminate synthase [Elusimicrobiales bacterium]|nr:N-acetylneuraminate synthase [Elusimicrobiales bacterium]
MSRKIYIIAEAGVNHNGSILLAKKLALAARRAGADAVKFQTFRAGLVASARAPKAGYQVKTTGAADSQLDMLRCLELSRAAHLSLRDYCRRLGIEFLSTPFDTDSVDLLVKLGVRRLKIPSGEITNLPLLRKVALARRPIIMSTGMAEIPEIARALKELYAAGARKKDLILLHCNTEYPTPMKDVNLRAMAAMGKRFGLRYGYSDHTRGITVPVAAAALGAELIEKHLTLDKKMKGPDHKASLDPREFAAMVAAVREAEEALGDGLKRPSPSERNNIAAVRRSIAAILPIKRGEVFTVNNIAPMRPAGGISPMKWDAVVGRTAPRDFRPGEKIRL